MKPKSRQLALMRGWATRSRKLLLLLRARSFTGYRSFNTFSSNAWASRNFGWNSTASTRERKSQWLDHQVKCMGLLKRDSAKVLLERRFLLLASRHPRYQSVSWHWWEHESTFMTEPASLFTSLAPPPNQTGLGEMSFILCSFACVFMNEK